MLLGCIGDDFTGSSDLANTLTKAGMRTVQYVGVPGLTAASDVEAGVVSLKSRSIPAREAVEQSLAALTWLRQQGCEQFFFKYCSTFDSTPEGNIGPVAEALADALDARKVIVCPAFPATGRSVYQGHLFVKDHLLNESGMENHPLTPMTDPDLRRWLGRQATGTVGHVPAGTVFAGSEAVRMRLDEEDAAGHRLIVCDAVRDADLLELGRAARGLKLVTGGSGVAMGLPANFGLSGAAAEWQGQPGRAVALAGSCSTATRSQVAAHPGPKREIVAEELMAGEVDASHLADWAVAQDGLPLVYSSADPDVVRRSQDRFGGEEIARAFETFFADLARAAVARGATRVISAGGETSGAVVGALGLSELAVGPEIDPGVPAIRAGDDLVLALKSGNFGAPDFFEKANRILEGL